MRTKLIDEILYLAGDEFGREELIQLAKKNINQLRVRLDYIKQHERTEINNRNKLLNALNIKQNKHE